MNHGRWRGVRDCPSSLPQINWKSNLGNVFSSLLIFRTLGQLNGFNLSDVNHPQHKLIFTSTLIDEDHYDNYIWSECVPMTAVFFVTKALCLLRSDCEVIVFTVRKLCSRVLYDIWCVFAIQEIDSVGVFSAVLVLEAVTANWTLSEILVSSFITHKTIWSFLTLARTACVCIVHCLFGFCFQCVYINVHD